MKTVSPPDNLPVEQTPPPLLSPEEQADFDDRQKRFINILFDIWLEHLHAIQTHNNTYDNTNPEKKIHHPLSR